MAPTSGPWAPGGEYYEAAKKGAATRASAKESRPKQPDLPFAPGDCVKVFGLESDVGRPLNGQKGVIVKYIEETGRFEVRFGLERSVNLKPENLKNSLLGEGDRVELSAPHSEGGPSTSRQQGKVIKYVEETDMFQVQLEPMWQVRLKADHLMRLDLKAGDKVEISGLESEGGRPLNGQRGRITKYLPDSGRFEVSMDSEKLVTVKPDNLVRTSMEPGDTVQAYGLESESGVFLNGQNGSIVEASEEGRFDVRFATLHLPSGLLTKLELPFAPDDCVEVHGLGEDRGGKQLNGQKGVVAQYVKKTGEFQVRFGLTKAMNLPPEYLRKFSFNRGDSIEVRGLSSESGRPLNGQTGVIIKYILETGRFEVRLGQDKVVNLKSENLMRLIVEKMAPQGG